MKTMKDVLECAIYTTQNYKSDVFFAYYGHIDCINLSADFNGWTPNSLTKYFINNSKLKGKTEEGIDKIATDMINWIEKNRVEKDN